MEYRGALVCACSQRYPGAVEGSMVAERQPKKVVKKPSARRGKSQAGARVSKKSKSSAEAIVKLIDPARLPLFTLLSFVLVAFTIEFDNEGEHRMPHWTTKSASGGRTGREGVWLTSMVMYLNCMKFVPEEGIRLGELFDRARTPTNLAGMLRWGYVTLAPDPGDTRKKAPEADQIVRATPKGKNAKETWSPLFADIERRWEERFGKREIDELRSALRDVAAKIDGDLPECMPILHHALVSRGPDKTRQHGEATPVDELPLVSLVARVLNAFALEFDGRSRGSLAIGANILRVLDEKGVALRDLPGLSGVSKESISMAMGVLKKHSLVVEEKDPAAKSGKLARLTPSGVEIKERARRLVEAIESEWHARFGDHAIRRLRAALQTIVGAEGAKRDEHGNALLLYTGMRPHEGNWRATLKAPVTLPHFPMVLHRGGYPDGS
jgi:DNA-binding MarR family transcriptional regulator